MKEIHPYLFLYGRCEEALNFWKDALAGEITMIHRYDESPQPVPDDFKKKIMHAEFKADKIFFMASDGKPGQKPVTDSNIALSINFTNEKEQTLVFDKLARGGKVEMQLQDTFWGARFGMLIDKFGIFWMLNFQKTPK